jgi:hypothetical protein
VHLIYPETGRDCACYRQQQHDDCWSRQTVCCLYHPGNQVRMHSVEATSGTATAAAGPVAVAACRAPASRPDCCVRCKRGSVAEAAVQADYTVATTTGDQQHQFSTNSRDELWLWLLAAVAAVMPAAAAAVGTVVNSGLEAYAVTRGSGSSSRQVIASGASPASGTRHGKAYSIADIALVTFADMSDVSSSREGPGSSGRITYQLQTTPLLAAHMPLLLHSACLAVQCFRGNGRRNGERRRKSVRGCIVSPDLSVLNLVSAAGARGEGRNCCRLFATSGCQPVSELQFMMSSPRTPDTKAAAAPGLVLVPAFYTAILLAPAVRTPHLFCCCCRCHIFR